MLDPADILSKIKDFAGDSNAYLLCYEAPEKFCHRHMLAAWLNHRINAGVKEWEQKNPIEPVLSEISGPREVYPYDTYEYQIDLTGGQWKISNSKAKIVKSTANQVTVEIVAGRSGEFNLMYCRENEEDIILPIVIK